MNDEAFFCDNFSYKMQSVELKDQMGNTLFLAQPAKRIVSLVPSQTELLYDLGLMEEVVGITKFCVHPAHWIKEKKVIGGTKNHQLDKIHDLQPDLIIANKEENTKQLVEKLARKYPVYISDITSLEESYQMISDVGVLTGTMEKAGTIVNSIIQGFEKLKYLRHAQALKVAYCIWKDPWMWAGSDTFITHLLHHCRLENVVKNKRYPEINWDEMQELSPQYILLSSEPYPFKQKHMDEVKKILPNTHIIIVDGEFFSWYGSRLLHAPKYFTSLLEQIHAHTL